MYTRITSTQDLSTIVTLDDVKRQLNILDNEEDTYITSLMVAAVELVQEHCHKLLTSETVEAEISEYKPVVQLPYGNVSAIDSVTLDGEVSTDYEWHPISQKLYFNVSYSNAVVVYVAGYTQVPNLVKQAVYVLVSTMYNYRDEAVVGFTVNNLPVTVARLLGPVKYHSI